MHRFILLKDKRLALTGFKAIKKIPKNDFIMG